ncbi:MAG: tRNA (adenosine(37)-N6)-threonylcarbamoyltransferase complex ATPase subunit type 1 TsaE [Candidatus Omnitrophota bacterium]
MTINSKSPYDTIRLGKNLGKLAKPGDVIVLVGELGSGKTTLTKGIAQGLGVKRTQYITSPSFVIAREYKGKIPLYHIDLYRLDKDAELDTTGFEEYLGSGGVCVIEWGKKVESILPQEHLTVHLNIKGENKRQIKLSIGGRQYKRYENIGN